MINERYGMILLAAVILVIACTVGLVLENGRRNDLAQVRAQGTTLARVISRLAPETLVPLDGRPGLLSLLFSVAPDTRLRYARLLDHQADPLGDVAAPGVAIPAGGTPATPSGWYSERQVTDPASGTAYREFHAPLLVQGTLRGHVRIGYSEPVLKPDFASMSGLALFAFPIFLLAPLTYYLVRREVRPLRDASAQLRQTLEDQPLPTVQLEASGEVGKFISQFNAMLENSQRRVAALEDERLGVQTQSKVMGFQKARIEAVLQSVPEGILVLDEARVATYANEKFGAMLGLEVSDIIGRPLLEWCNVEALATMLAPSPGAGGGTHGALQFEREGIHLDASACAIHSPRGNHEPLGTLILVADTTAEVNANKARQDLVAQLSHELKTPLHVVNMYSEMLIEDGAQAGGLALEAGNIIHDEVERVTGLINNILNLGRIEMGSVKLTRTRTRLNELLRDSLTTVEREAKSAGVQCHLIEPSAPCVVNVDKELLRVAVNNLLTNAVKYNRTGGDVVLELADTDTEVIITVRDTGIGIAPEHQGRVFDKFYRVDSNDVAERSGHGLGLALAHEIVQVHMGELHLHSTVGEGTEFRMVFKKTPVLIQPTL